MSYLFERHIRPRLPKLRRRMFRHMEDEFHHHLDRAERSARLLRFIETYCDNDSEIYETFTIGRLSRSLSDTRRSLEFNNRVLDEGGFFDAYESHEHEILSCLSAAHVPSEDKDVLREIGSVDPDNELRALVYAARDRVRERSHRELSVRDELKNCVSRLEKAEKSFEALSKSKELESNQNVPKKSRRWFKGVGQIAQGSALSIADVALATGVLHLPVSSETQSWGAIASVATGIGTILNGVGDLRAE
ncbi:MAG TPA: hypothetical protein VE863_02185 [Pyrinomonadaceae bacterium]|nr:hypothetical protein [Pyrinomonadaceae bacterium]